MGFLSGGLALLLVGLLGGFGLGLNGRQIGPRLVTFGGGFLGGPLRLGQCCGVFLGGGPGGLFGQCQAFAHLGKLHGLRLVGGLRVGQALFQPFGGGLGFIQLAFQVLDGLRCVGQFAFGLLALLASRADDFGNAAFCCFHGLIVQLDGKGGQAVGQRLGYGGHFFGNLNRQFCNRLGLGHCLAVDELVPNLFQAGRVAPADLLAQRKAGDVAASGLQFLTSFNDLFRGEFGGTHGGFSCLIDGSIIAQQTKK